MQQDNFLKHTRKSTSEQLKMNIIKIFGVAYSLNSNKLTAVDMVWHINSLLFVLKKPSIWLNYNSAKDSGPEFFHNYVKDSLAVFPNT